MKQKLIMAKQEAQAVMARDNQEFLMRLIRLAELKPPSVSALKRDEMFSPLMSHDGSVGEDLKMAEPAAIQQKVFRGSIVKKKNPAHSMSH